MININNITKLNLVNSATLNIKDGQHIVITGKNGTGKTTLIRMLAGICIPDTGELNFNGQIFSFPLSINKYRYFFRTIQKELFYAENYDLLYENFTIEQNLKYFFKLHNYNTDNINEVFQLLEIKEPFGKFVKDLSLGTKQKILAVLVLLTTKNILILDEPTLGMDNDVRRAFMHTLLSTKKTLLISTHDEEFFDKFDTMIICDNQNIITKGIND